MQTILSYEIIKNNFDVEQIAVLYEQAQWSSRERDGVDYIVPMLTNSFVVIGAFDENRKLIGMGRALSDGVSDAYILDIVVDEEYRHCGIGGQIVEKIALYLKQCNIGFVTLISAPGKVRFYEKHDFELMNGFSAMKLR